MPAALSARRAYRRYSAAATKLPSGIVASDVVVATRSQSKFLQSFDAGSAARRAGGAARGLPKDGAKRSHRAVCPMCACLTDHRGRALASPGRLAAHWPLRARTWTKVGAIGIAPWDSSGCANLNPPRLLGAAETSGQAHDPTAKSALPKLGMIPGGLWVRSCLT